MIFIIRCNWIYQTKLDLFATSHPISSSRLSSMYDCTLRSTFARYATFHIFFMVKTFASCLFFSLPNASLEHYIFFCMLFNYSIDTNEILRLKINNFSNFQLTQNALWLPLFVGFSNYYRSGSVIREKLMASFAASIGTISSSLSRSLFSIFFFLLKLLEIWNDKIAFHHQIDFTRNFFIMLPNSFSIFACCIECAISMNNPSHTQKKTIDHALSLFGQDEHGMKYK